MKIRLFKNDRLEALTSFNSLIPILILSAIIGFFLFITLSDDLTTLQILLQLFFGLAFWTLFEYYSHRFIYHMNIKNELLKRIQFIIHGVHHFNNKDKERIITNPTLSLFLFTIIYFLFRFMFGLNFSAPAFLGFVIGAFICDLFHYALHVYEINNRFFLYQKRFHLTHHVENGTCNYGISSPLWDYLLKRKESIEKSGLAQNDNN